MEVDYYRREGLFVLRDDGRGMTREQFVDRWLTIATETTVERKHANRPRPKTDHDSRPVLGEKGIGRLAIATIAPQVLVLTRARRGSVLSDLTAAFLNWRVFECPQLDLGDIRIPLRTFPGGTLPDGGDVADMVTYFRSRNTRLRELIDKDQWERIDVELGKFAVDPLDIASYLGEPTLLGNGCGTHFYLLPRPGIWQTTLPENRIPMSPRRFRKACWDSRRLPCEELTPGHSNRLSDHKIDGTLMTSSARASSSPHTNMRMRITRCRDDSTNTASSRAACPCMAKSWTTTS